ncbi:hypothetical protein V2J09_021465 [Rumex salicifolius]
MFTLAPPVHVLPFPDHPSIQNQLRRCPPKNRPQRLIPARKWRWRCFASEKPPQYQQRRLIKPKETQSNESQEKKGVDPVGFLNKLGITHKAFAQFLRERHKAVKDIKDEVLDRFFNLKEFASGYELMGVHRTPQHRLDFMDWAPGARYCALVGDFNDWSQTENCAREGRLGHDDYGYWFIILEDKLRDGEEPDELYFQMYNYVDDYDKGDNGVSVREVFKRANDEYWEPGECRDLRSRIEVAAKLYEQMFGPNGPQSEEELEDIPDAETRYKAYKEKHKDKPPSFFRYDVIDQGKEYDIESIVDDPVSREKFRNKKPPIPYWYEIQKGRKAWMKKYAPSIPHGSKYRVYFNTPDGPLERVPAWATYVLPDVDGDQSVAVHWEPPPESIHRWKNKQPKVPKSLRIYECHVGISGSDPKIASFVEFVEKVLPHIKEAGYNAIQFFGVIEHKDYYTAGYRVTNMFAVSSRYGTPEDFKRLVDEAHGLGLLVFLDIVHSYAAADEMVGLSLYDGSNDCYFHTGSQKFANCHSFLLLSLNFLENEGIISTGELECSSMVTLMWVAEYQIDGFHFHSISSMLYTHNGFASFTGELDEYCNQYVDKDAMMYLILANDILHFLYPNIITIAEDTTNYPGLCEPTSQGGLGFDYYVNLSAPDMWSSLLQNVPDHEWNMSKIVETLTGNKLYSDKMLMYAENHNQSLSGGCSFAEILFGGSTEMNSFDRGCSLHKMLRLITFTIGGHAYLNFMGNEFGHPKRVEFPTQSNDFSLSLAHRSWDLLNKEGIYQNLFMFDKDMMKLDDKERVLSRRQAKIHHVNETNQVISYIRGPLLFIFNFNPTDSFKRYRVGVEEAGEYQIILNTDEKKYGGQGLIVDDEDLQITNNKRVDGMRNCLEVMLPSRSAQHRKVSLVGTS